MATQFQDAMDPNRPAISVVKIWTDHQRQDDTEEYVAHDWVMWAKRGANASETSDKVERVRKHNPVVWGVVEPVYNAWKAGEEDIYIGDGTPLSAWPAGVNEGQVMQLRLLNMHTVEHVAESTDADMERIGMGARALRDKARAFVEIKKGDAKLAEALAARDQEIKDLRAALEDQQRSIDSLTKAKPQKARPADAAGKMG